MHETKPIPVSMLGLLVELLLVSIPCPLPLLLLSIASSPLLASILSCLLVALLRILFILIIQLVKVVQGPV